jgi:hypothetical protein
MPNIEALDRTMAYLLEHQERWYQLYWARPDLDDQNNVCGTSCCFAGFAILAHGYTYKWEREPLFGCFDAQIINPSGDTARDPRSDLPLDEDGTRSLAIELLDLTQPQARALFDGANTLEEIQAFIEFWRS